MNTVQPGDTNEITSEIWRIIGGDLTPDSIGPERYDKVVSHVRAHASEYLDAFESMFLGENFDAQLQSELHATTLLKIVADVAPERVRSLAEQLLKQMDSALAVHDQVSDREALFALLPEETVNTAKRLEQRRAQLRELLR